MLTSVKPCVSHAFGGWQQDFLSSSRNPFAPPHTLVPPHWAIALHAFAFVATMPLCMDAGAANVRGAGLSLLASKCLLVRSSLNSSADVHICTGVHVSLCIPAPIHTHTHAHTGTCAHTCPHVHIHTCTCTQSRALRRAGTACSAKTSMNIARQRYVTT